MNRRESPDDAGAHESFAEIYREHAAAVYRLARRLAGSDSEAEDIASETFLVAWRRWDEVVRDERPAGPWLLGVAARQALNATRGRRRRGNLVTLLAGRAERHTHPDPADEVTARLEDLLSVERTKQALRVLTPHEAEALALCVWSELSYADAAAAMGVSVGSVRNRLARARRKLRAELAPDDAPDDSPDSNTNTPHPVFATARSHS